MLKRVLISLGIAGVIMVSSGLAHAACSCADYDGDGRYGIVDRGRVIAGNIGSRERCLRSIPNFPQCGAPIAYRYYCADWDGDGRYGIVRETLSNGQKIVVRPNLGSRGLCNAELRVSPFYNR